VSCERVSAVVPARNAAATIGRCLDALLPRVGHELVEVVVVDDGSQDATAHIARERGARVVRERGRGAAAARNTGWRAVDSPWVWFVDADCVAEPDALEWLCRRVAADDLSARGARSAELVGVGGSYSNLRPDSLVATLIHEEIVLRHAAMPTEVDFLATFDVLYRRSALEKVDGFDERFLKAQDAELAFRLRRAGGRLGFERRSRVGHFHDTSLRSYLRTQRQQGYWRVWLYFEHPGRMAGDSYSGGFDHLQPPLALLSLASLVLAPMGAPALPALSYALLELSTLPMTWRLVRTTGRPLLACFAPFAALRAHWRGIGMAAAALRASLAASARALRGRRP